jgi:hypothetical protein
MRGDVGNAHLGRDSGRLEPRRHVDGYRHPQERIGKAHRPGRLVRSNGGHRSGLIDRAACAALVVNFKMVIYPDSSLRGAIVRAGGR